MAAINDLIRQIEDKYLRDRLQQEVARLSKQKKFGLVFEDHIPECTPLYGVAVRKGSLVAVKGEDIRDVYYVSAISDGRAAIVNKATGEKSERPLDTLVAVAQFGEPIFPSLIPIDSVENAPDSNLWHTLIEADNFHALQLLEYLYPKQVDCIYIDPPYNTGARDWKYNNDYVDAADSYRHSKWLSMMQRRLRIAKRLLKPSGMLITTIDDNEYANLYLLIKDIFPEYMHTTISIQMNPGGTQGKAFSVTNEYAIVTYSKSTEVCRKAHLGGDTYNLRRWGSTSNRYEGATCFYPIIVNESNEIIGFGGVLPNELHPKAQVEIQSNGTKFIWPIDVRGTEKKWRYARDTVESVRQRMFIEEHGKRIEILLRRETEPPKTIWVESEYNAEAYGTKLVKEIIGKGRFSYPKSLYATKDCLAMAVANNPNALIVDFFAGSGTTLHAVNLLNAEDGGNRRCILVTNNEVSDDEAKALKRQGHQPGDEEWEKLGIARYVTWPRTVCSIKGVDINGDSLKGNYGCEIEKMVEVDGEITDPDTGKKLRGTFYKKAKEAIYPTLSKIKMADGFAANAEYFKLGFLDKSSVELGASFKSIIPMLWLQSGAVGKCPELSDEELPEIFIPENGSFAVLLEEYAFSNFKQALKTNPNITHVYIVTNSHIAFREMASQLTVPAVKQLYRDYIDNFTINARRNKI